jgi:hypothetical protein
MGAIVTDIQLLLNDAGVFWPQAQILDAVNEAQLWAQVQTKWLRKAWLINLPRDTDIFQIPSDVLVPGWMEASVANPGDGSLLTVRAFPTTQRELEHFLRTWRSAGQDAPQYFVIWDASHFRVFPRPDRNYVFTLWGITYPPEILDGTGVLQGLPNYTQAVQNMALSLLLNATRPDLGEFYLNLATSQIMEFRKHLRNMQGHNILRLKPATTHLEVQQGGRVRELPTYYPMESSTGGSS